MVQAPKVVINNEQVWKAIKAKKETNLGFYLYQPSMLLPNLQEHLNGIVQVRIPARYLSYQNPKVKKRAIWGTGIYTDDSDVVSMAIHSGKFIPEHHDPELESNDPFLMAVAGKSMESIRAATRKQAMSPKTYLLGRNGDDTIPEYDIKVTLRVLPKLQDYTSTIQHRIKSRQWGGNHDGVSFYVEKVEQLKKGEARSCGRSSLKTNLFRHERYRKQAPRLMNTESNRPSKPIDHVV
ncbi:histone deacetylation protein Rxt3-domain-containing protein [Absidia repens]|uniref:Histone deacetylation protein Rxt3-domain-containing protein n=1 Tax=Absidia repens TaxID=90262 RepID=A0A1X2IEN7_9FUNG|nr:histone deacetylation protein Rxt3-domain-containing protein [Absidia repens]